MAFTSKDVMELRQRTGVGMMDCKKALVATDGDMEAAIDFLREKGMATAAKKEGRIAAEGIVYAANKNGRYVLLEVNCESDFVAGGPVFKEYVDKVAGYILDNPNAKLEDVVAAMQPVTNEYVMKMGEKLSIRRFTVYEANDSTVDTYIHMGGKIAVAVALDKEDAELGKGLAMHIAANNPQYLSLNDVAPSEVAHEKEVQLEAAKNDPKLAGKPAEMLAKIIDAKVTKYYSEMVLGSQIFLMDDSKTVAQVLKEKGINVLKFVRYQVGEGIEKRKDDFASEVMNEVNK